MSSDIASNTDDKTFAESDDDDEPRPSELETLYNLLASGKVPELTWQNPGRRAPSPEGSSLGAAESHATTEQTETQEPTKNDFDFDDDVANQPQIRPRTQNSTPKSAKKKTANFAGVMEVLKKKSAEGGAAS